MTSFTQLSKALLNTLYKGGLTLSLGLVLGACSSPSAVQKADAQTNVESSSDDSRGTEEDTPPADALEEQKDPSIVAYKDPHAPDSVARQAVAQAYDAMQHRQWDQLLSLAPQAQADHELGAYPLFWYLRNQLSQRGVPLPTQALQQFIDRYPNTYVAERIKAEWAIAAAREGDFAQVTHLEPLRLDLPQAQCAVLQAQAMSGKHISDEQALSTFTPGDRCWAMLQTLVGQGQLGFKQLQPLLRDAVEYDNRANARQLASLVFSPAQLRTYDQIMSTVGSGKSWPATQQLFASWTGKATGLDEELRAIAFSRLARQDRDQGIALLESTDLLTPADKAWAYTQFGLMAVLNQETRANDWYKKAGDIALSDYNAAWRTRAALMQANIDWAWVKKTIQLMNKKQEKEATWVYWKARADAALGNTEAAKAGYQSLKHDYGFYGQLAQEELGHAIQFPPQAAPVTAAEITQIQRNTGLQNAMALFKLGAHPYAVMEWKFAIRGLSDRQLLAAAEWANQEGFYDRTINTSLLTKHSLNFNQRYVSPFEGQVEAQAQRVGIQPSWVYGLIRQESRFVLGAKSSAGASGLMQLMPGTARLVAKQLGMSYSPSQVHDFDTNTLLGTTYLKNTLDKVGGSEVLATAGYNAGPNRAIRWKSNLTHPTEGAIFAETIPFTETRLYVKHVMSNAVWYDVKFTGQPKSLKKRLGVIVP